MFKTSNFTGNGRSGRKLKAVSARLLALALLLLASAAQAADVAVTDISFSSKPGSIFEIRMDFDGTPPDPKAYTIEKPARISMDFEGVSSALERKKFSLPYGNATGVMVLESGDRTRMIINMVKLVPYQTRIEGNSLIVEVGNEGANDYLKQVQDPNKLAAPVLPSDEAVSSIEALEFQRSEGGEGRLLLTLSDPNVDVNVFSEGGLVKIEFLETTAAEDI
jgi:type IV pilus assembly protein PilQ